MLSLEQLTKALKVQRPGRPAGWWTSTDLKEATGWTQGTAGNAMRAMMASGKIRHVGTVAGVRIDGVGCKLPAYVFTHEEKARPARRQKAEAQG